jgi:FtsZ-interacting cell division protein ZipA
MEMWQMIAIIVIAIVALAVIGWAITRQQRTKRLTEQYGPEYERTVKERGDQRDAERELEERQQRVRDYEIHPLPAQERDAYATRWRETQAEFVDDPSGAISKADGLVQDLMSARGYPVADFEQRAADVSVDHPHVVEEYRAAHAIAQRHAADGVQTEDLRQAMVHYRALFDDLLEVKDSGEDAETAAEREEAAAGSPQ